MDEVITERIGAVGSIRLTRPAALNALNLPMFQAIAAALEAWRDDPRIAAVVVRGTGKAFSAGGDIRAVRDAVLRGDTAHNEALYRTEYGINGTIAEYPKPYLALVDGYCMGGGLGLALHASYRVVGERAVLAMPETAIGFFPDIGCTYVLPRLPDAVGIYLGLTGYRMDAADAIACGVADRCIPVERHDEVERLVVDDPASLGEIVDAHAVTPGAPAIAPHRAAIARCFGGATVAEIVAALEREGSDWARETLTVLRRMSPTALTVSRALFARGATMTLRECLEMERRTALRMLLTHDFSEGVRAMVVDKDRNPTWSPAAIEDVNATEIERLTSP